MVVGSDTSDVVVVLCVVSVVSVSFTGIDGRMSSTREMTGEMMGSRRPLVVVVVSGRSLTGSVVLDESALETSRSVVGELEVTTPVGAMTIEEVVSSVWVVAVVGVLVVVVSVSDSSSSLSVGKTTMGGMPPLEELRSEGSWVGSSDDSSALVEGTGSDSSGAVVWTVGDTLMVLWMMTVVTEPPLLRSSVEVEESPSSLDRRSLTVDRKLVRKFLDSDRDVKGVLSGGGNASWLVIVVFVNWRLTWRGK